MIELCSLAFSLPELGAAQLHALLDIPDYRVLQLIPMGLKQLAKSQLEAPCPPYLEDLVGIREVRLGVIYQASQGLEHVPLCLDDCGHTRVNRESSQITTPRDSDPLKISFEGKGKQTSGFGDGNG